ncbi:MAG: secretin N-terminal domain-containing protein [Armatimonadota bacterium]|nr:hypothetical protein [Armatimonadota bacterium]MCX7777871.1 hypothetical protein [Armatimonadota bacterium]MDW8025955.1 secretin N-terminal domain-containing protein [Armatimonadota bacterium]
MHEKWWHLLLSFLLIASLLCGVAADELNGDSEDPLILRLELEDATVADACQMVFEQTEAQYYITLEARSKRVARLSIRDRRLSEVLDYIVKPAGLYWWRDKSGVFIISDKPPTEGQLQKPQVGKPEKPQEPVTVEEPIKPLKPPPTVVSQENEPPPVLPRLVTSEELKERIQQEQQRVTFGVIRLKFLDAFHVAQMLGARVSMLSPMASIQQALGNPVGMTLPYPPPPMLQMLERLGVTNALGLQGQVPNQVGTWGFIPTYRIYEGNLTRGEFLQAVPGALPGAPGAVPGAPAPGAGVFQIPGIQQILVVSTVNALIVYGTPEAIAQLRQLIDLIDIPPDQIEIESQFVALQRNAQHALGINWAVGGDDVVVATSGMPGGTQFTIGFVRGNLRATLGVLLSRGEGKVIRAPRVVTTNNQPAAIMFSTVQPIFMDMLQVDQFGNPIRITLPVPMQIPVGFTVLPRVNADMSVTIFITPMISEITGYVTNPVGGSVPIFTTASTTAYLTVRDGESFAIGGLTRGSSSTAITEVPLLARLPIIGELFKGTQRQRSEEDMIIFVTPRVIRLWPEYSEEALGLRGRGAPGG